MSMRVDPVGGRAHIRGQYFILDLDIVALIRRDIKANVWSFCIEAYLNGQHGIFVFYLMAYLALPNAFLP